ncbi:MAG: hypothetical protein KY455_01385 [Euryarchaeota archaeon]|nr:hypothetical protein [Euryarchaeota archaeon]
MGPDRGVEPLPVVLVHGVLGQELLYWNLVRARLETEGFQVLEAPLPRLALGRLTDAGVAFGDIIDALLDDVGAEQVDVVAHSAGGLAVRHALMQDGHRDRVRRLMTLGSPHGGTRLAHLVPGFGIAADVRPGSPFLAHFLDDPTPGPTCYSAFWTRFDGIVIPSELARLPSAPNVENVRLDRVSHWGYLYKPRVARVLADELRRGFVGGEREIVNGLFTPRSGTGADAVPA